MIDAAVTLAQSPLFWAPALVALLTLSGVAARLALNTYNRRYR